MSPSMQSEAPGAAEEARRMLASSVAALVERRGGFDRVRSMREKSPGYDREVWNELAAAGLFGLLVPEDAGGLGLGSAELAVVMHELGRGLAPEPVAPAAVLALGAIRRGDGAEAVGRLLPGVIEGAILPALAWQEANASYGPADVATRLEGGRLTGVKRFVPAAGGADGFVVSALGLDGLELAWVEAAASGVEVAEHLRADGGFLGTVTFKGAPVAGRIASPAVAAAALGAAVEDARLAAAAELVGVMEKALEITVDYVKQRKQFGRPIGAFQALQHRIVDLWTQQELARSTVRAAVQAMDRDADETERAIAVAAAKARASDAALLVTRQGIQLHGGIGYTDEYSIGLFVKRALVLASWLGNGTEMHRRFAALAPEG